MTDLLMKWRCYNLNEGNIGMQFLKPVTSSSTAATPLVYSTTGQTILIPHHPLYPQCHHSNSSILTTQNVQ